MAKKIFVFDIEVYPNYFLAIFKEYNQPSIYTFEISDNKTGINEFNDLYVFFNKNIYDIPTKKSISFISGFNIIEFDIPLLLYMLLNKVDTIKNINKLKDRIIEWKLTEYSLYNRLNITEHVKAMDLIDIYKMNKWDDDSRRASLKWVANNIGESNILETPVPFDKNVTSEDIHLIKEYCKNDVLVSEKLITIFKDDIKLRHDVYREYGIKAYSMSNTSMGYNIFTQGLRIDKSKIRYNEKFPVSDILYPVVKLDNKVLFDTISKFNIHEDAKLEINYPLLNNDGTITLCNIALGGIHGIRKEGIYMEDDDKEIMTFDVASYYPSQVIGWGLYPRSIGKRFLDRFNQIREERLKAPKGSSKNKALKEALNSAIGMSKMKGSNIYDARFFYSITINGQLLLVMLCEEILKKAKSSVVLMVNTDGCEIMYNRDERDTILGIMKEWEKNTRVSLEHDFYHKLVLFNVNNYIGIKRKKIEHKDDKLPLIDPEDLDREYIQDPPTTFMMEEDDSLYKYDCKLKGVIVSFKDMELYKNFSTLVINKAIYNYFVFGVPIMQSIMNNTNIFDFIEVVRRNKKTKFMIKKNEIKDILGNKVIRMLYVDERKLRGISLPDNMNIGKIYRINESGTTTIINNDNCIELICNNIDESIKGMWQKIIKYETYIKKASKFVGEIIQANSVLL